MLYVASRAPECWLCRGRLGRGLGLECLCSEVICHLRGFPQLCVGHSVGVEKADFPVVFTLAVMYVCMLIFVEKTGHFLRYEFAALFKRNLGVCGGVGLIPCIHFLKRTKTQRIAVIAGMFNRGQNTSCLSVCIIKLRLTWLLTVHAVSLQ